MIASAVSAGSDLLDGRAYSLGLVGVLLVFVFRTLWKQETNWQGVVAAARQEAKDARLDAAAAREDAHEARADAKAARDAEHECRLRLDMVERRLRDLESRQ